MGVDTERRVRGTILVPLSLMLTRVCLYISVFCVFVYIVYLYILLYCVFVILNLFVFMFTSR